MNRLFAIFILLAGNQSRAALVDCQTTTLRARTTYDCKVGTDRHYLLHLPPLFRREKALPVVLSLHGGGATPEGYEAMTGLETFSDERTFILVTPAGVNKVWNAGSCCDTAAVQNIDDVGYLNAVLDQVQAVTNVDSRRIVAIGFSNGSMLAHRLGCEMSHRLSGFAAVSGGLQNIDETGKEYYKCQPTKPLSVLVINGKPDTGHRLLGVDSCAPFEGGTTSRSASKTPYRRPIQDSFDFWKNLQACGTNPVKTTLGNGNGRMECSQYQGCKAGTSVKLCTIPNGEHWWPGAETPQPRAVSFLCGRGVSSSQSASQIALDFLL